MEKKKHLSLRTGISLTLLFLILFSFGLLAYSTSSTQTMIEAQVTEVMQPILSGAVNMLDSDLDGMSEYLFTLARDFDIDLGSSEDPTQSANASVEMSNLVGSMMNFMENAGCIIAYSPDDGGYQAVRGQFSVPYGAATIAAMSEIQTYIKNLVDDDQVALWEWQLCTIDSLECVYYAVKWNGLYFFCIVDLQQCAEQMRETYQLNGQFVFSFEGTMLTEAGYSTGSFDWNADTGVLYTVTGADQLYAMTGEGELEGLKITLLIPQSNIGSQMDHFRAILLFLGMLIFLSVLATAVYVISAFIRPMNELMRTMRRIIEGDLSSRPSVEASSSEFQTINDTFDLMVSQIVDMKMEAYEKDLKLERSRSDCLKLQIRPHFYINCLKSMYGSISCGKIADAQNKILYLSNHFRYVFSDLGDTVDLSRELDLCQNYVEMMGIGEKRKPQMFLEAEEELLTFQIPPVTILSFVENTFKYCSNEQGICIKFQAQRKRLDNREVICITYADNGPGYPQEILDGTQENPAGHVGIQNVMDRLRFTFKDSFEYLLTNQNGARVDLFIYEEDEKDESSDRG